jgi:hypothetical protein
LNEFYKKVYDFFNIVSYHADFRQKRKLSQQFRTLTYPTLVFISPDRTPKIFSFGITNAEFLEEVLTIRIPNSVQFLENENRLTSVIKSISDEHIFYGLSGH